MNIINFQQWHFIFILFSLLPLACHAFRIKLQPPYSSPKSPPNCKNNRSPPTILQQVNEKNINGDYKFYYLTSDHQMRFEEGQIDQQGFMVVKGQYRYCNNGILYITLYHADRNGYHASTKQHSNIDECLRLLETNY